MRWQLNDLVLEYDPCEHGIENCIYCNEIDVSSPKIEQAFIEYCDSIGDAFAERSTYFEAGARWMLKHISRK